MADANFPVVDISVLKLSDVTICFSLNFDCGLKDLNDFLAEDALRQQKESVNVTFLWVSRKTRELLGYITLCNDSIHLFGEKKEEMKTIGISYKALPALKVCRMAVSNKFAGRGLGTKMIAFAVKVVLEINEMSGCRFLTLEAKNDETLPEKKKPVHFYKKLGFSLLKERKQNASYFPMYKDLKPLINEFIGLEAKKAFGS
ncbi:MAG: GNAT family N-acetyltransferase [Candidatus Diapherotrites archaeon]